MGGKTCSYVQWPIMSSGAIADTFPLLSATSAYWALRIIAPYARARQGRGCRGSRGQVLRRRRTCDGTAGLENPRGVGASAITARSDAGLTDG
jgi:hypothetical protein